MTTTIDDDGEDDEFVVKQRETLFGSSACV